MNNLEASDSPDKTIWSPLLACQSKLDFDGPKCLQLPWNTIDSLTRERGRDSTCVLKKKMYRTKAVGGT